MGNLIDEIGNTHGRLTVLARAGAYLTGAATWRCRCVCGQETVVAGFSLRTGNTVSCGCYHKEINRFKAGEACFNQLIGQYKRRAKQKKLSWNLSKEQMRGLVKAPCHYCGIAPYQIHHISHCNGSFTYNGLDRIDSSRGYQIDNVVPCCGRCNMAKSDMSLDEFRLWLERTYRHMMRQSHA